MMQHSHENTEDIRHWLNEQELFEFMVKAIKGEVINNQRLSLRDRVHLAAKLSNKIMPDLKATEQKTKVEHNVSIRYQATHDLISDIID